MEKKEQKGEILNLLFAAKALDPISQRYIWASWANQ